MGEGIRCCLFKEENEEPTAFAMFAASNMYSTASSSVRLNSLMN